MTYLDDEELAAARAFELDRDEYKELKAEQRSRMSLRDGLITSYGSLIAVSALAGQTGMYALLLIVAPFCAIVGWNRIGQDVKTSQIGRYINGSLAARQYPRTGSEPYAWETYHAAHSRRRSTKIIQLGADLATFVAPGIVATVVWAGHGPFTVATIIGLLIGLAMSLVVFIQLIINADIPARERR